jgi:hypothetical protein
MAISTKKIDKSEAFVESKKAKAEKRREKVRQIESKFKGGDEPSTDPFNYKMSLIQVTNWYNLNIDFKQARTYIHDYLISTGRKKLVPTINKASDIEIKSLGVLSRLKLRDQYLEDVHTNYIEDTIKGLLETYTVANELEVLPDTIVEPKIKVDKTRELAIQYSEDIEGAIDDFVKNKKSDFDITSYLKAREITGPVAKDIGSYYNQLLKELEEVETDPDLQEGYSNFTKSQMKKFISFVSSIVNGCNQRIVSAKVSKPKVNKPVPAAKIVAKVKYLKEFVDLKLKSIAPTSLVDSNEIWTYNTKYRKLAVYKAVKDTKLTIKGTAIQGFDITESIQIMLRKPEEFFNTTAIAKKALSVGVKTLNAKTVTPNGRLNEDTILLGAF